MEYKNEQLGVSFSVPDSITVRQQLAYYSDAVDLGTHVHCAILEPDVAYIQCFIGRFKPSEVIR